MAKPFRLAGIGTDPAPPRWQRAAGPEIRDGCAMSYEKFYEAKPWLAAYQDGVPEHIDYEEEGLPYFLDRSASEFPDSIALLFQGYVVTYKALKDLVDRFAACLADFGIRKGDSVSLLLPNTIPCVAAYYAILKVGGIAVMNNPLYSDQELEHQFKDSDSKALICMDLLANRMIDLRPKTSVRQIVYTSIGDYLPLTKRLPFLLLGKRKGLAADVMPAQGVHRWKDLIKQYPPQAPATALSLDDTAMYQYTGGTTGVAKGVVLTHGNLSKQVQQLAAWFPDFSHRGGEVMLGALPFFHVFGLSTSMNYAIYMAWANVLVPRPKTEALLAALKDARPSFVPMVPTMYLGLVNHPIIGELDLTCINGCFSGSAPLPVEVVNTFQNKTGSLICEGFGMTESSAATHGNPLVTGRTKVGSIGIPLPDVECRIVDTEDGTTTMPVGERGEMIVRGPQVMKGYKGLEQETAASLRDGWLHTGDVALMDEEGYFFIVDRMKDMIISGGYNVYPREIDEVFFHHPKVAEACAIGIPHATRGEAIKVFVVLKQGESATEAELIAFCKDKLAAYKLPARVEFRDALPKNAVGKVLRKDLRAGELENRTQQ